MTKLETAQLRLECLRMAKVYLDGKDADAVVRTAETYSAFVIGGADPNRTVGGAGATDPSSPGA